MAFTHKPIKIERARKKSQFQSLLNHQKLFEQIFFPIMKTKCQNYWKHDSQLSMKIPARRQRGTFDT